MKCEDEVVRTQKRRSRVLGPRGRRERIDTSHLCNQRERCVCKLIFSLVLRNCPPVISEFAIFGSFLLERDRLDDRHRDGAFLLLFFVLFFLPCAEYSKYLKTSESIPPTRLEYRDLMGP